MVQSYLNPRLVRPRGENAARQAARLGPADANVVRAAAAVMYATQDLVFGEVNAHRLRALADKLELADGLGVSPSGLTAEEADELVQQLIAAQTDASLWERTSRSILNVLQADREASREYQEKLVRTITSLARDVEKAESAAPGIRQTIEIVIVTTTADAADALDPRTATALALSLLSEVDG